MGTAKPKGLLVARHVLVDKRPDEIILHVRSLRDRFPGNYSIRKYQRTCRADGESIQVVIVIVREKPAGV